MELTNEKLNYWKGYEKDTSPQGLHNKTIPVIKSKDKIEGVINEEHRLGKEEYDPEEFKGFSAYSITLAMKVANALIDRDGYCGTGVISAVLFQES